MRASPDHLALTLLLLCLPLGTTLAQSAEERPWAVGEVRFLVPELPEIGEVLEVSVLAETGGMLVAALNLSVRWNTETLKLEGISGGLTRGATRPFVTNDRTPGELVIADINVPQNLGSGATYDLEKQGRLELYRIIFRRIAPGALLLTGELTAFHDPGVQDPGRGGSRQPQPIGGAPFPRPVRLQGPGVGPVESPPAPLGAVWMVLPETPPPPGERLQVPVYAQLGSTRPGALALLLHHGEAQATLVGARNGKGEEFRVASLGGQLWITGSAATCGPADETGRVLLCTLTLQQVQEGAPALSGSVVSLHQEARGRGDGSPIGTLPLPRPITVTPGRTLSDSDR